MVLVVNFGLSLATQVIWDSYRLWPVDSWLPDFREQGFLVFLNYQHHYRPLQKHVAERRFVCAQRRVKLAAAERPALVIKQHAHRLKQPEGKRQQVTKKNPQHHFFQHHGDNPPRGMGGMAQHGHNGWRDKQRQRDNNRRADHAFQSRERQTLPFAIKLVAVGTTLALSGRWIGLQMVELAQSAFTMMAASGTLR